MFRKRLQKVLSSILCLTLAMMSFIGLGSIETAKAAVSPLITSYKPQVVMWMPMFPISIPPETR